jgi:hypothetical protein
MGKDEQIMKEGNEISKKQEARSKQRCNEDNRQSTSENKKCIGD